MREAMMVVWSQRLTPNANVALSGVGNDALVT